MIYGWAGTILRVDLTSGSIERESTDRYSGEFLGGKGINAKILWDEVTPEIKPLDPENLLIFGAGSLAGTMVPFSCRCSITGKSPQSGIFGDANFGGYFAPELKFAGFDHVVIFGRSERPLYLWINDGKIELRSAVHLWGKDTVETETMIRDELKDHRIQVASIGPAGENRVVSASINHGLGNVAARTGMGAVMGSKNLKAIAVRGTGDLNIARHVELNEQCDEIINAIPRPPRRIEWKKSFDPILHVYGNHDEIPIPEFEKDYHRLQQEFYAKYKEKEITCFNCVQACKFLISCPEIDGSIAIKCENKDNWLTRLKLCDPLFLAKAANRCHRYGLDMMSTTAQISFLMELYEEGIITDRDTDGIPMKWKNQEAMYSMIEKIAMREGCGELFADGIVSAAEKIGRGAAGYALHVKGMELPQHSHYRIGWALGAAVSERGDQLRASTPVIGPIIGPMLKRLPNLAGHGTVEGFIQKNYPREFWKTLADEHAYEGKPSLLVYQERAVAHIPDILGLCKFMVGQLPFSYFKVDGMVKFLSSVTGMEVDEEQLNTYCERMTSLVRAFNVREGITKKDDTIPDMFFSKPSIVTGVTLDRKKFDEMVGEVYSLHGWDENGIPTRDRLEELGIKYVADDLEERGIM